MTIDEKLDLILNECKDHYGHLPIKENWKRICSLVTDGDGVSTGNLDYERDPQLRNYLDYLLEEEYIKWYDNFGQAYYVATIKGLKFEGFVLQKINLSTESRRIERLENHIYLATVWVAVATGVAGLFALLEIVKFVYSYFHQG